MINYYLLQKILLILSLLLISIFISSCRTRKKSVAKDNLKEIEQMRNYQELRQKRNDHGGDNW